MKADAVIESHSIQTLDTEKEMFRFSPVSSILFLCCRKSLSLKVHYATFLRAVNKQKNRVLDARNSNLQELT